MNHSFHPRRVIVCFLLLTLLSFGCESEGTSPGSQPPKNESGPGAAPRTAVKPGTSLEEEPAVEWKRTLLDRKKKLVWFETHGDRRRVLVESFVCLREGEYGLVCLVFKRHTNEHE
jgi:hypothetical protein